MDNHIIFEKLDLLESTVTNEKSKKILDKEDILFFTMSANFILNRLKNTIPVLVQESDLKNIHTEINGSVINLNTYFGNNKNSGHLENAKNKIRSAINRIKNLPFPVTSEDFNFSSEITSFKKITSEKNKEIFSEIDILKTQISDLATIIQQRKSELENLENRITNKASELEKLNKTFEDKYKEDRRGYDELLENHQKSIKADTDELVKYLETKKTEASKIVNVIGNIGATGNFQQIANYHKESANILRVVAIVLMLGLSGLVICSVISLGSENFDWTKSMLRIIAATVLSYPATYAARESSKHRKLENYNRKLELELSSIEAFIELLPDEKKQSIKEKLAEKYFGSTLDQFDDTDLKSDKDYSVQGIERLVKAFEPLIKK